MVRLQLGVATAIAIIWCLAMLRSIVDPSYVPSPYISPAMMAVAGWLYVRGWKMKKDEERNGNGPKEE